MEIQQLHLIIWGKVQGVFYRKSALEKANTLDLTGFVRNKPNGCVELVCQGNKEQLLAMASWCQSGPPMADVQKIDSTWTQELQDFQNFQIIQ